MENKLKTSELSGKKVIVLGGSSGLGLAAAKAAGKKLKFVASYTPSAAGTIAAVGLQQVDPKSDFYHLYGKDNAVLFYTDRYPENPLVIKGAGAGAEVTASGVFADIIRAARL